MVIMTTVWMLLGTVTTEAQFVDLGQDPARTRWRQIRTEDFEIIYPDFFEERGTGIINASPFSMGLLTGRGAPDWHPAPAPLQEACRKAAEYCARQGYPSEKLTIQFAVSNPRIQTTLFSSANPDSVLKNIRYVGEPIDWDLVARVREIIGDQQRVSWANT